jgi:hypothetical protein
MLIFFCRREAPSNTKIAPFPKGGLWGISTPLSSRGASEPPDVAILGEAPSPKSPCRTQSCQESEGVPRYFHLVGLECFAGRRKLVSQGEYIL